MAFLLKCFGGCGSTSMQQPSATIEDLCHRFSLAQLRKSTNQFDQSLIIEEVGFYLAYKGCISINGEPKDVIVERLERKFVYSDLQLVKDNIIYRCQLHHPNVVSLVGFCDDENEMIVVYDYVPNGSLYNQLKSKLATISWKKRLEISIGVARGLHYLHSGTKRTLIHRNPTPSAILLDENWVPKLSFFWFSLKGPKFSEKDVRPIEANVAGSIGYIAPESYRGTNVTHKSDVFSFGAVLFELICGKPRFRVRRQIDFRDVKELRNSVETGLAEEIFDQGLMGEVAAECWKLYMDITESCMSEDPDERPDMGEVEVLLERALQLQEEADNNLAFHAS
ncbi:receptor-like protein kinase ANXUR2 [Neltuma alba]|uniref:receptor-like protein kinase ANXUR2 n=1 Tax=Neltuma alba TaxID=207710 RepID=UPI0010A3E277|nr:receptor-like protein kinase ANXUR2 [Prosopis alba]